MTLEYALTYLSGLSVLFPVAVLVLGFKLARGERRDPSLLLFLWYAAGLFAATLAQRRFVSSFSLPMAMTMAWALHSAYRAMPDRYLKGRVQRGVAQCPGKHR